MECRRDFSETTLHVGLHNCCHGDNTWERHALTMRFCVFLHLGFSILDTRTLCTKLASGGLALSLCRPWEANPLVCKLMFLAKGMLYVPIGALRRCHSTLRVHRLCPLSCFATSLRSPQFQVAHRSRQPKEGQHDLRVSAPICFLKS